MTEQEQRELSLLRVMARLRHMYQQMTSGHVRPDQDSISSIAHGILSPCIMVLEEVARSIQHSRPPEMAMSEFTPE